MFLVEGMSGMSMFGKPDQKGNADGCTSPPGFGGQFDYNNYLFLIKIIHK